MIAPRSRKLAITLLACLSLPGCDSSRLRQFNTFAAAGSQYVVALHSLTAQAGSAMIAVDSATLSTARNMAGASAVSADSATYTRQLVTGDILLQQYLANLQRIDQHASLLASYFETVTTLTDGKASAASVIPADALLDSINTLNPEVEKLKFQGKSVKDFLNPATSLAVAHFAVKGLDRNLSKAAPIVDTALSLQEAAVTAISDQLKSSLTASLEVRESTDVINPYVANAPLPASWVANREAFLRTSATIVSVDSATGAIIALHKAFRDLVANKQSSVDLRMLMEAINEMGGYATAVQAAQPANTPASKP